MSKSMLLQACPVSVWSAISERSDKNKDLPSLQDLWPKWLIQVWSSAGSVRVSRTRGAGDFPDKASLILKKGDASVDADAGPRQGCGLASSVSTVTGKFPGVRTNRKLY